MNTKRFDIYVGFGSENIKKENFIERLSLYCKENKIGFSLLDQIGGYVFNNGDYIIEDSIRITLMGNHSKEFIKEFVDAVKKDYKQESILVNVKDIGVQYN